MKTYRIILVIVVFICLRPAGHAYSQSLPDDLSSHPYLVTYWVSGSLIGVGAVANILGIPQSKGKKEISLDEIQSLNTSSINSIDSWALRQDPTKISLYENYSDYTIAVSVMLPGFLLFDKQIKRDWLDVLMMYAETMSLAPNIYEWTPLGPAFQNKFRPVTYYTQLSYEQKKSEDNRNSFYSGHVATVAASTFFMAKVYSDYNPEIGNNKYLLYGAALVPPVILGYFRVAGLKHFPSDVMVGVGVGALVGIIVPEIHRLQNRNVSFGLFSSPEESGFAVTWQPNFLD
jgi:PAP2 superfamily